MSDSGNISLTLGTIIKIIASYNDEVHDKIFIITYLDDNVLKIENPQIENTISLNIKKGTFTDESLEQIEILSYPDKKGFARQNDLLPGKWISINFGGKLPTTINGKITNLEDDMIEITTYPQKELIYINFDYKGIPLDLPILSINEIPKPIDLTEDELLDFTVESKASDEEDEEEEDTFDEEGEDEEIKMHEKFVVDNELTSEIDNELTEGLKIIFLEEIGQIEELVNVSESEKRFSLEEQRNDLMDSLLSNVPTLQRNSKIMNYFHKIIERYTELRSMFSILDNIGNIVDFKKNDKTVKSIIDKLVNFDTNYKWLIPVARNKKKIYNISLDEDDFEINNNITEYKDGAILTEYLRLLSEYKQNEVPEGHNKFYFFMKKILNLFKPHELTIKRNQIIKEDFIQTDIDILLDNLKNFESYTITSRKGDKKGEKSYFLDRNKFITERYTKGLTTLSLPDKYSKNYLIKPLIKNDKLTLVGLLKLPYTFMKYSRILLHNTSIFEKSNLDKIYFDYNTYFKNLVIKKQIKDDDTYEFDFNFLNEMKYYTIQSNTNFEDQEHDFYKNFLNKIIPTNREIFNLIKTDLPNKNSYDKILKSLEPFGIYENDIGFMLYRDIVLFIEENNNSIKKEVIKNIQIYSNYLSKISKIESKSGLFKVLEDEDNDIFEDNLYKKFSNFNNENLNNIFLFDNGNYLFSIISKLNTNLLNDLDVDSIIDESLKTSKKTQSGCKSLTLSKRYVDVEELQEDDNIDIYFDKKFDETRYDIMEEFTNERATMSDEDLNTFLIEHCQYNVGMTEENAAREASALIMGKKIVIDGDFAILDLPLSDDPEMDKLRYYERKGKKWNLVDEFTGRNIDSLDFCNLQQKCLKIKNDCNNNNESKKHFQERLNKEIHDHFDNELVKTSEEISREIKEKLEKNKLNLIKLKNFKQKVAFSKNNFYNLIASTLEDTDYNTSPLIDLRDIILGTSDFIKKNTYIIRFVEKFCRLKDPNNSEENNYWYYCISSGLPLLPTFFYRLASVVVRNLGSFKNDYLLELDKIVHERGKQSTDGDCWVDEHSGYVIKYIEASNDEGYTDEGYKIVSRDVIQEDIGVESFMNKISIVDKKYKSPLSKKIKGIVDTLNSNIGIRLKDEYLILIVKNVHSQLSLLKTSEEYEVEAKKLAEKGKRIKPYNKYIDETLILSIISYYILAIQISIPNIIQGKAFKGCSESFLGFPITDNGDLSLVDYIICVAFKIRNASISPWNVLQVSRKKEKMDRIKNSFKEKVIRILTEYALKNDEIINLIIIKRDYILESHVEIQLEFDDFNNWNTFLPITNNFQANTHTNVAPGFHTNLLTDFQNFDLNQYQKIFSLQGKIRNYSFAIQKSIRNCIEKQNLLLESHKDNTIVPYLENSCCLTSNVSSFDYFVQNDSTIQSNNNIVKKFEEIMTDVREYTKAQRMISYENTKFKYPLLPNSYSEEIIYMAYIKHCKFESIEIPSQEIINFCSEKGIDLDIKVDKDLPMNEKIQELKQLGVNLSINDFLNIFKVINKENIVPMELNPVIKSNKRLFESAIEEIVADDFICGEEIYKLIKEIVDTYTVESTKHNSNVVKELIEDKNDELLTEIIEFLEENKIENRRNRKKDNIITFLNNFLDWKTVGEGILSFKEDQTGFKVGEILKNMIENILLVFPSMIINGCNYKDKKAPKHWNLDAFHNVDLQKIIHNEFADFNKFFGDKELVCFLNKLIEFSENLIGFCNTIPIFMKISESSSILDGTIYKNLLFNFFLCSIKTYILMANNRQNFEDDEEVEEDDDNMFISEIDRQQMYAGSKMKRTKKIGNLLKTFLHVFYNYKDKYLDFSNESIKYKILKAKEKEKEKIKNRLKNLSIEERDVEDYLKNHRLGDWNVGQTKSLFQYQQDRYQKEMEDMLSDLKSELEVGMVDEVTEMRREIYGHRMDDVEDVYRNMEDEQSFSLAGLWDDDDGEGDGDTYFN